MGEDCELLFFDTFSHDTCEELNLDLVQFPRPVYIFEIRVIPLGARVQADFPGGHRLGATNPSSFQLEFFVNDLSKRSASTFERLGSFDYKQNVDIQFPVSNKIPTDGLVLRGWYSAVTLAVYGVITKVSNKERSSPPPPPPPQATSRSQDHCPSPIDSSIPSDWERNARIPEVPPEPPPPPVVRAPVEPPRFDVPPMIHPPPEQHVPYPAEIPNVMGAFPEPPPSTVYPDCGVPPPVAASGAPYAQYDAHYNKPWVPPETQYPPPQTDQFDHQLYNRPPDGSIYPPPQDASRPLWDPKDHHGTSDISSHDREGYNRNPIHEIPTIHKDKDRGGRDRPWDRDLHDYKDDDGRIRDHDSKRNKDRGRRSRETSWERSSVESDRYRDRDRDRMRDSSSRDRDRDRDRNRDRSAFMDRGGRKEPKRPSTPPSPRKARPHTPQTPPDAERIGSGPRTPKEDEPDYDERGEIIHHEGFFEPVARERGTGEHLYNLSEGEIQDGDNTEEDDGYEEIVSEEEDMSDGEDRAIDMTEMDYDLGDETWNFMSSFSPYNCELSTFHYFSDPTLFPFEITEMKLKDKNSSLAEKSADFEKILDLLDNSENQSYDERWVEILETINENILIELAATKDQKKKKDIFDRLLDWVMKGLDFELALNQSQTPYKVRHLKAGIRLATLLFETNEEIIQMLMSKDVPKLLIQLYEQPYMVLPVKLLILRGIDSAISTHSGMNYLVQQQFQFPKPKDFNSTEKLDDNVDEKPKTCYQKLLDFLLAKQLTRATVSISALLSKIHLYEVLLEVSDSVEKVVTSTPISDVKSEPIESPDITVEQRAASVEPEMETIGTIPNSCEASIQVIVSCLQEITMSYQNAWKNLAQTKRFLPARNQFEFPKAPCNPYPGLLRMFKQGKLLENIFVLLSSPALSGHPAILSAVKDLLLEILSSQEGKLFLLSLPDVLNGIQRALLHTVDDTREEGAEDNAAQNLGMQIGYHLQALLYVDCLLAYHARDGVKNEPDEPDTVSALHHMYTMVFSPIGRPAVVNVLSAAENLNCLLPFVQMSGDEAANIKQSKSVCAGYVTELLMVVVHYSEDVPMLEKFSDALYNLSQQDATPKLHELGFWIAPTRSITSYNHEAVASLMGILKTHTEDAASLPPELITSLRILQHLCIPQGSDHAENVELKYMYAVIQVFSNNGMDNLKLILQNVCDLFLKPSHQSPSLVGIQGVLVVAVVKPAVLIMRSILAHLISSRGTEFKDLTAVQVLLKSYSLMLLVPQSSLSYQLTQLVQFEIIEALLAYTQPYLGSSESEEALSKSLWTEMLQEVLNYTMLSPSNFVTGLTILSELLPLPLPLQTREEWTHSRFQTSTAPRLMNRISEPLTNEEVTKMVNYRKLWSAHLHSLSSTIQELIVSLAATSCHPMQQLLRRVCVQLVDLAAPTALFIVRSVMDALLETLVLPPLDQKENLDPVSSGSHEKECKPPVLKPPSSTTARILTLVAYLVSHASFKIPLMHILKGSVKADEKYLDVLPLTLELFNTPSEKPFIIQSQECIVSILQSLCDPDISFITFDSVTPVNDVLASSLPSKEHMSQICGALVKHIGCHKHSYSSVLPSLRSLVMLTEHDYGFYYVKQGLEHHPGAVYSLFTRFSSSFSKDSSDCLSTLSTTLEFLRLMVNGYEDGAQTGRTALLSASELADLLRENTSATTSLDKEGNKASEPFQPIVELEKQLTEFGTDEEAVESLLESISSLLALLNSASDKDGKAEKAPEMAEPVLPSPESQSAQFASRSVFVVGDVEEGRLSPAYWLSLPAADDADQEQEQVAVDLIALAEKSVPGEFNLKSSLESLCLSNDSDGDPKTKKKGISTIGGKRKYSPFINPALVDVNNKRPFIAPMRGRGFSRASSHSSRANDPFRSRPPNTSRPPSMHVDDFLALESHHSGSSSQAQAKRPQKEGSRGRGRGFDRNQVFPSTRGTGGRFFSPPGSYGRRESNRGGNRGGANRISSNTWGNRSNPNSGQKLSPGAGQRSNFSSHRNDYNSPFNQQDMRQGGQRNRDPYSDLSRPSNIIPLGRFQRGLGGRAGGSMGQTSQGHWQDRNKSQNQRY